MNAATEARLRELLSVANKHDLAEMCWEDGDTKIAFRRGAVASAAEEETSDAAPDPVDATPPELIVRSPMVGTFRRNESKNNPPLIMEGNHIKVGDRLGIVECMKVPTDVVSFCAGEVKKVLVQDSQPVEYGQPLFLVTPDNEKSS